MMCLAVTFCYFTTLAQYETLVASPNPSLNNNVPIETQQDTQLSKHSEWFDVWQQNFTDSIDFSVRQFDDLFAPENKTSKQAKAEGRLQLSWEPRSRDLAETDVRFRIRVSLPHLENRVDLLLSDNEDETQSDTIKAARSPSLGRQDSTTIALRFRPDQESHYSYRIGAGRRDQIYVKGRYRDAIAFNNHWVMLYDGEVYYYNRDQLGSEIGVSFRHTSHTNNITRFNNRFYFRDKSNDWLWRHEIEHLFPVNKNNTLIYSLMVEGLNKPTYQVEEVYTGLRWRSNPIREWLYFDLEPFVLWLRDEDFSPSYGLALRLEAYYGKDE